MIALLPAAAALAQADPGTSPPAQQVQQPAQPGQQQVAQQCQEDLAAFRARMDEDGYWLTGWRYGGAAQPAAPPVEGAGAPVGGPWGSVAWQHAPHYELGTLYEAAAILARRGDEQGCQTVLAELTQLYDRYTQELRQAGVDPGQVAGWRAQQLAAAQPVEQIERTLRLDEITGTDLRNLQDEYLGSIEDIVFDPRTGGIAYVVVERGGFLGIGSRSVAVPWQALQATPGLNTFVLNVDEQAMENAPEVDPEALSDPTRFQERRQEIEQYWQQRRAG